MSSSSVRGQTTITIGGQDRVLRFKTNEIAQLEDLSGKGIMTLMSSDVVGIKVLRDALFVGLLHDNKKLTPNKVGNWLDSYEGELSDLITVVFSTLASAVPGASQVLVDSEDEEEEGK